MGRPAAKTPCAACPWRLSNQGKRHPNGWYTKANLRRLWKGLRRGEPMSCHPTDPHNPVTPEDEAAGHKPAPEGMEPRECAGSLIVCQREAVIFDAIAKEPEVDATKSGLRAYRERRKGGMTREGLAEVISRYFFGGTPLGGGEMSRPDLNDSDVGHPDLPWPPRSVKLPEAR